MPEQNQFSQEEARKRNRVMWDEITPVHVNSYGVDRFLAGEPWLPTEILEEVGTVRGKSMLHLQCHFGLDSLAWVRESAEVTGVDFSPAAIAAAQDLSRQANLPANFICADIYDLPKVLNQKFDIVFTSIGVLCWLNDLEEWARIIARYLKPGGIFYIMDGHPLLYSLDDEGQWTFYLSYFHNDAPYVWDDADPDYMDRSYIIQNPSFEWQWSISDIINAVLDAGLNLQFFHEFSAASEAIYPEMVRRKDGFYSFPNMPVELPVIFSLKAQKPEAGEVHG